MPESTCQRRIPLQRCGSWLDRWERGKSQLSGAVRATYLPLSGPTRAEELALPANVDAHETARGILGDRHGSAIPHCERLRQRLARSMLD
jgi:hypothetical protein